MASPLPIQSADGVYIPRSTAVSDFDQDTKARLPIKRTSEALLLADAFSEFISASTQLEKSYRELQDQVNGLDSELATQNAALIVSREENERMRIALQQIVDSMPCGVIVASQDGNISMINPESMRILGLNPGHPYQSYPVSLESITAKSGIKLPHNSTPGKDAVQELCIRDIAGERWVEIRNRQLSQHSGQDGDTVQTILILRDITAQKRMEQEREAGRNAMALAEITAILAHEIRNPLASLELFAELIEKDQDNIGEWISNLRAGIRSLSGTVDNVLSFHGSGSLRLSSTSLSHVLDDAIQFMRPLADQAAVSLHYSRIDDECEMTGNHSALKQVVLNLISNALRHTPAGGHVTVSLQAGTNLKGERGPAATECFILDISDTGCGIRPDQIAYIFNAGFSGNGDTSGLGLSVCQRVVERHGGQISVTNNRNSGASFTLKFPISLKERA